MAKTISIAKTIGVAITVKGITNEYGTEGNAAIRIFSESGCDEGAYYPAQDIQVYGTKQVTALRDFCNEVLEACKPEVK
jgi:hypothetical protein